MRIKILKMSDNRPENFSETFREQLDEIEDGNLFAYVGAKYIEAGFSHTGGGKRAICVDCHLEPRSGQVDNLLEVHSECRPRCPYVLTIKKRNMDQTNVDSTPINHEASVEIQNRSQLVPRARRLSTGESTAERLDILRNKNLCQVCKTRPRTIMFTPCNCVCSCEACADKAQKCIKCQQSICSKIDIYRS